MIINLISGPRNISTALMYAFAQHSQVKVIDEPFYAHYLTHTGLNHPGRKETLASMSSDANEVLDQIKTLSEKNKIVFIKNMAHHHEGLSWDYLKDKRNVFLIRNPKQLIASFAEVIPNPSLQDIGLKYEADLLAYLISTGNDTSVVINSHDILSNPKLGLTKLCESLGISFEARMLSWNKGPIPEDGSWAKYWYKNVHNSTGFAMQKTSNRPLPKRCETLYKESLPYYEKLQEYQLDFHS